MGLFFAILGTLIVVLVSSKTPEVPVSFEDMIQGLIQVGFISYVIVLIVSLAILLILSESQVGLQNIAIDLSIVAIFGGFSVLSTKALSSLLTRNWYFVFTHWLTYILIFVLVSTAVVCLNLSSFKSNTLIDHYPALILSKLYLRISASLQQSA